MKSCFDYLEGQERYLFYRAPISLLEPIQLSLSLVWGLSGRTVKLTTPHIVPGLLKSGTVSLFTLSTDRAALPYLPLIRRYVIRVTESAVNKPYTNTIQMT